MLLSEVDSGKMLKYSTKLNPKLWSNETLNPDVKVALDRIQKKFIEYLNIDNDHVIDVVLTGSMCNYSYTKYSDIDLHIIVDYDLVCDSCENFDLDDCMKAKKTLWNEQRDITIHDHAVELYVQSDDEKILGSAGVYSLLKDKWVTKPTNNKPDHDFEMIDFKAEKLMSEIDDAIENKSDVKRIESLKNKIWNMRRAGLKTDGENSLENQVFKVLRNEGYLDRLREISVQTEDDELSLT